MEYGTFAMILGILFWVLCALGVVSFMIWLYTYVQYFKWDKEDRYQRMIVKEIQETIKKTIEESDKEQYDEFEEEKEEDEDSGGN